MSRKKFEFYCSGGCQKYFDFTLNTSLNGNYRLHCPNCEHTHYRVFKDGKITDQRFDTNDKNVLIEDIYPMKSSCRDYQKEKDTGMAPTEKSHLSDMPRPKQNFLSRLWKKAVQV